MHNYDHLIAAGLMASGFFFIAGAILFGRTIGKHVYDKIISRAYEKARGIESAAEARDAESMHNAQLAERHAMIIISGAEERAKAFFLGGEKALAMAVERGWRSYSAVRVEPPPSRPPSDTQPSIDVEPPPPRDTVPAPAPSPEHDKPRITILPPPSNVPYERVSSPEPHTPPSPTKHG